MYVSEAEGTKLMGAGTVRESLKLGFGRGVKEGRGKESIIEARKRQFNVELDGHLELRNHWEGRNLGCSPGEADYANIRIYSR